jgi:hypothetical protein
MGQFAREGECPISESNLPYYQYETGIEHSAVATPRVTTLVYNEGDNVCGKVDIEGSPLAVLKNHVF